MTAVEPLHAIVAGAVPAGGALRQAAHAAIAAIQARLGDVEAGRLALAEPGAGALAVAAEAGALAEAAPAGGGTEGGKAPTGT